jgi:dihydroxyacetone synthase
MHTFGLSAPQGVLYEHYGFGVDNLAKVIGAWKEGLQGRVPGVGEFAELLNGHMADKHYAGRFDMYGKESFY